MESSLRLLLLRIILACIILNAIIAAVDAKKHKHSSAITELDPTPKTPENIRITKKSHHKHLKKTKRSAYERSWSKEYGHMPPYLVFNRKTGSYYPYYTHQDNNIRRNALKRSQQSGYRTINY